jgi:thiol-disulfide isomerase/thioredoxin
MSERVILVVTLAVLVAVAVLAVRAWTARTTHRVKAKNPAWDALGEHPDGRRTLIAFSTPTCAACHKAQAPAIDRASNQLGEVRVIKVDASRQPEVAKAFGILTVPSTVVLAAEGDQVVAINQGFAPSARLVEQLQRA